MSDTDGEAGHDDEECNPCEELASHREFEEGQQGGTSCTESKNHQLVSEITSDKLCSMLNAKRKQV